MSMYSTDQLEKGQEAFEQILISIAKHDTIPSNFHELSELPVEIQDPDRVDVTYIKKIGELTAQDLRAYVRSEEFKDAEEGTTNDR